MQLVAKSLKETVADLWLTLVTRQQGVVIAGLGSAQQQRDRVL